MSSSLSLYVEKSLKGVKGIRDIYISNSEFDIPISDLDIVRIWMDDGYVDFEQYERPEDSIEGIVELKSDRERYEIVKSVVNDPFPLYIHSLLGDPQVHLKIFEILVNSTNVVFSDNMSKLHIGNDFVEKFKVDPNWRWWDIDRQC